MQKLHFKTSMFRSETQRSDFHSINGLERLSVVYFDPHLGAAHQAYANTS